MRKRIDAIAWVYWGLIATFLIVTLFFNSRSIFGGGSTAICSPETRELMEASDEALQVIDALKIDADAEFELKNASLKTRFQITNRTRYAIAAVDERRFNECNDQVENER